MNSAFDTLKRSQDTQAPSNLMVNELERQLNIIIKHPSLTHRFIEISNLIATLINNSQQDNSTAMIQPYVADIEKMASVRILIKYLHYFANSFVYSPVNLTNHHQREIEIKQAVWISKYPLQKTFYTFIKTAFQRWPMDYTFRQPLETWLSYIQPWRYVDISSNTETLIGGHESEDNEGPRCNFLVSSPSVENNWRNFMSDNLLFYTVMFGRLINRLLQLDLSSSRNALMLYRVIKVYSQPGFLELLREAEETVCRSNLEQKISLNTSKSSNKLLFSAKSKDASPSRAKLLAPNLFNGSGLSSSRWLLSIFKHPLMELESEADYDFVSLFSPQMKQQLARLLQEVHKSRESIKELVHVVKSRAKLRNKSWIQSIHSFFSFEADFESRDEREMYTDKLQADDHLSFVSGKIIHYFGIPTPEDLPVKRVPNNSLCNLSQDPHVSFAQENSQCTTPIIPLRHRAGKNLSSTPKAELGRSTILAQPNSATLTPLGRYQLMNKLVKSDNYFEGNPDLQPVRSFEIHILVTFFIWLSRVINERYGDNLQRLYQEDSLSGWIARFFLYPPTEYVQVQRCLNSITSTRSVQNLPARVNLRRFAQRRIISVLAVFMILMYFYF